MGKSMRLAAYTNAGKQKAGKQHRFAGLHQNSHYGAVWMQGALILIY
jgi:hypothetical protein